jgi:hypothetical protein
MRPNPRRQPLASQTPSRSGKARRVLGEFAIIFAGVTLGLLADDWRETRDDRRAERVAVESISEDLLRDSIQLATFSAVAQGWDRAALWARRADPRTVTAQEASSVLRSALGLTLYQPVRSSYSSLKDSGQLELVDDSELRRSIVEYYEEGQPTMMTLYEVSQGSFFEFQSALWPYFISAVADSATSLFPSQGLEPRASWQGFWDDPTVLQALEELGRSGSIWEFLIPGVLAANSKLRRDLAGDLSRSSPSN